jgi:hypothetical protein
MNLTQTNTTSFDYDIYSPGLIIYIIFNMTFVFTGSLGNLKT